MITGKLVTTNSEAGLSSALTRLIGPAASLSPLGASTWRCA